MRRTQTTYTDLTSVIPPEVWQSFDFMGYWDGERNILKPWLESQGYTEVRFEMGERDSFGPLSRIVYAVEPNGRKRRFIYG